MPLPVPSPLPEESSDTVAGVLMYALGWLLLVCVMVLLLATVLAKDTDKDSEQIEDDSPRHDSLRRRGSLE